MSTNFTYIQYSQIADAANINQQKYEAFKERISKFENVSTIEAAKELAKQILPTANEINMFDIGSAKCVVVNTKDLFRITLDSVEELICYDFVSPDEDKSIKQPTEE